MATTRKQKIAAGITAGALVIAMGGGALWFRQNQLEQDAAKKAATAQAAALESNADAIGTVYDDTKAAVDKATAERIAAEKAAAEAAAAAAEAARVKAEQDAAAKAAADEAARKAAQKPITRAPSSGNSGASNGLAAGTPVPQPNGYPDTTQCASSSASTVNGVPVCD